VRHREQVEVHIPLVQHLRQRARSGVLWWHSPQGAHYAGARQGALMKALGTRPGVADLVFLHRGQFYALELKKLTGARATAEQGQFLADVRMAGGLTAICHGLDEALAQLESWNLLIGTTEAQMELRLPAAAGRNKRVAAS